MNGARSASSSRTDLSAAQITFLKFAHERPKPFAWRWARADGSTSLRPATHALLVARKKTQAGEAQAAVTVAELEGLAPYWASLWLELNAAGLEAARQASPSRTGTP